LKVERYTHFASSSFSQRKQQNIHHTMSTTTFNNSMLATSNLNLAPPLPMPSKSTCFARTKTLPVALVSSDGLYVTSSKALSSGADLLLQIRRRREMSSSRSHKRTRKEREIAEFLPLIRRRREMLSSRSHKMARKEREIAAMSEKSAAPTWKVARST
jgi:hypothetical protein